MMASSGFAHHILSPKIEKVAAAFEYLGSRSIDGRKDYNNHQAHDFRLEYGLTDNFMPIFAAELERDGEDAVKLSELALGGKIQFTEEGNYWIDSGALIKYNKKHASDKADSITTQLLLEKTIGKFTSRANIGIETEIGKGEHAAPERLFDYSASYRFSEYLQPAIEVHSNFGRAGRESSSHQQEHQFGPAIYGKLCHNIRYQLVYLIGVSEAASRAEMRGFIEYEHHF